MKNSYHITVDFSENLHVAETLYENLKHFNESIIGLYDTKPFCIFAASNNKEIIGGIKGDAYVIEANHV